MPAFTAPKPRASPRREILEHLHAVPTGSAADMNLPTPVSCCSRASVVAALPQLNSCPACEDRYL